MKSLPFLIVFVLCFCVAKGHSLRNFVENSVSETGNGYLQTREDFLSFLPSSDKSEKHYAVANANDDHARKKRTILSAAAFSMHALRRQQLRWQNKLERTRLRNERNKLRNDYRTKALNDRNQKLKAQIDQLHINQQLSRQQQRQRLAAINKQSIYPMNFQDYLQMQNKMNLLSPPLYFQQHQSPLNFQQHPLPNNIPHSTTSTMTTVTNTPIG